jgi:hypothetical protein
MATAWYEMSKVVPAVLKQWQHRNRSVEVWKTTCIVTNFGKPTVQAPAACKVVQLLINPANPQLSGVSKFPYFPRGGPAPKQLPNKDGMGYVSTVEYSAVQCRVDEWYLSLVSDIPHVDSVCYF